MNPITPLVSVSRKFYGYLKKDFLLLVRRKKYLYLFIALPFIIGLLFLFFLNPSPGNIKTAVCDHDNTQISKQAVSDLQGFKVTFLPSGNCTEVLIDKIKSKEFSIGLEIPRGFSQNLNNLEQSRILVYYDNTDIALSNLVAWRIDSSLAPYERTIINKLNNEIKSRIAAIRTGVDVVSDFAEDYPSLNTRVTQIDNDLKNVESIDTEFIVNPIWTDHKPIYNKPTKDAGFAFVFPIITLFVVLMLASTSLIYDKKTHFLLRVKASTTPLVYLLAKLVFFFAVTLANFLIILILFVLYGSSFSYNLAQIINLIFFISVTNTLVGLLIGLLSDNEGIAILFSLIISLPFMLISGIFYPIQTMPTLVQYLAKILPLNYQIDYSKTVLLFDGSMGLKWMYPAIVLFVLVYYIIRKKY